MHTQNYILLRKNEVSLSRDREVKKRWTLFSFGWFLERKKIRMGRWVPFPGFTPCLENKKQLKVKNPTINTIKSSPPPRRKSG